MTIRLPVRLFLLCGVVAPLLLTAFVIAAGLLTTDYDYLSHTISQIAIHGRPHALMMNAGFIVCGLLLLGFAYGLYRRLGPGVGTKALRLLLTALGIGIILSGVFHADPKPPGVIHTLEGNLHNGFAGVAYAALLAGMAIFAAAVRRKRAWRGFARMSLAAVALSSVLLAVYASGAAESVEGALQLSFLATSLVWIEAVAIQSLRLPFESAMRGSRPG